MEDVWLILFFPFKGMLDVSVRHVHGYNYGLQVDKLRAAKKLLLG